MRPCVGLRVARSASRCPIKRIFLALDANDNARWLAWLNQQLEPDSIADGACDSRIAGAAFMTLAKTPAQLWTDHHAVTNDYFTRMLPVAEVECATLIRQTDSRRQPAGRSGGLPLDGMHDDSISMSGEQ